MSRVTRLIQLLAAFLSLGAAIALLAHAGLPERASYSGYLDPQFVYVAPEIGSRAPGFELWSSASKSLALEQVQADAILINFWASWCLPCRDEMQLLQRLYQQYPGELRILAVNLGESAQTVRKWKRELGLSYDILLDPLVTVAGRYQLRGQPTSFLLDAAHRIQRIYYGAVAYEQLWRDIESLDSALEREL